MFKIEVKLDRHHFETGTPSDPYRHPFALALAESSLSGDGYKFRVESYQGRVFIERYSDSHVSNLSKRLIEMGSLFDSRGSLAFKDFSQETLELTFTNLWSPHVVNLVMLVTPRDVGRDEQGRCTTCPVWKAINRSIEAYGWPQPYGVYVSKTKVTMESGPMKWIGHLPSPMVKLVREFDELRRRYHIGGGPSQKEILELLTDGGRRWHLTLVAHPQLFTTPRGL